MPTKLDICIFIEDENKFNNKYDELGGTINLVFCSGYKAPTLSSEISKEMFSVQGAWQSPRMFPSTVHGQAFRIITCQLLIEIPPQFATRGRTVQLCRFEYWEPSLALSSVQEAILFGGK